MAEISALVQPEETNVRWSTPNTYQELLKREHAAEFLSAELLYGAIDEQDNSNKLNLLQSCRTNAWFIRHITTGEVRVASNSCKLRWCPMCQIARQNYITQQVSTWFRQVHYPKLLTITLRHTSSPLKSQVDFLYKCFQKFRKRKFVSKHLRGGVWFFQVKKSKDGNTWHPHIHAMIDADFMDRKKLSSLWAEITGGSTVIDIRAIFDTDRAVKHNARYCTTPMSLVDLPPWERYEVHDCFNKRRLVGCFGTARHISLRPKKPVDSDQWLSVGSWSFVVGLAGEDSRADEILLAWKTQKPLSAESTLIPLEHNIDDRAPPEERPTVQQQWYFDFYTRG